MAILSAGILIFFGHGAGEPAGKDEVQALREEIAALRKEIETFREEQATEETYQGAPPYGFGAIMNPDLSVVVNLQAMLTDAGGDPSRNRVRIEEAELVYQGYVYPGIRTDVIGAFELDYGREDGATTVETHVHLEEAYLTVTNLPLGIDRYLALQGGRKLLNFGRLNSVHPHHRPFPDTPLPLEHFLGSHGWNDDGVQAMVLLPNPFDGYDLYVSWTSGLWNGKELHAHEEAEGDAHEEAEGDGCDHGQSLLPFRGLLYQQRLYGDFPIGEDMDLSVGGSFIWDEYGRAKLYGSDVGYHYQWPLSFRRTSIEAEFLWARVEEGSTSSFGFFAYVDQMLTKYIGAGVRYDWSEYADNDSTHAWLVTPYVTYYLNESTYLRASYRYRDLPGGEEDSAVFLQVVWGLGPHSHRLSE